jgi:hypothetical protein
VGGCIRSYAGVHLKNAVVSSCHLSGDGVVENGGAIYAEYVTLEHSAVTNNSISGTDSTAYGGGVMALYVLARDSAISNNAVTVGGSAYQSVGGGIAAIRALDIESSTISGNQSLFAGGVLFINDGFAVPPMRVADSTVSGNVGGGMFAGTSLDLLNSTLTQNIPTSFPFSGCGLVLTGLARIQSTIAFGNLGPGNTPADIGSFSDATLVGANNLIGVSGPAVPHGTISVDPVLGPLTNNGGPTLTHALLAGSPAIDAGNNAANLAADQRGSGYVRVSGAAADIGAFEAQPEDVILRNGFD